MYPIFYLLEGDYRGLRLRAWGFRFQVTRPRDARDFNSGHEEAMLGNPSLS